MQRNDRVADYLNFSRHNFCDHPASLLTDLRPGSAGHANADSIHLLGLDMCSCTRLSNGLVQPNPRLSLAYPNDVATSRGRFAEHRLQVAHHASGLGATGIDSQKDRHEPTSTTGLGCGFELGAFAK
jgi:hypothetical protein